MERKIARIETDGTTEGTTITDDEGNEFGFTSDYVEYEGEDGIAERRLVITSIFDVESCESVDVPETYRVAAA